MLHRVGIARLFLARWVELNFRLLLGMMHDVVVRVVVRHGYAWILAPRDVCIFDCAHIQPLSPRSPWLSKSACTGL
jgi:hypothetical protein